MVGTACSVPDLAQETTVDGDDVSFPAPVSPRVAKKERCSTPNSSIDRFCLRR